VTGRGNLPGVPQYARLPFEPLGKFVATLIVVRHSEDADSSAGDGLTSLWKGESAENAAYWRAKKAGWLTVMAADQLAVSLGLHPCLIWGDEWFEPYLTAA
jgi:hypothetical protein